MPKLEVRAQKASQVEGFFFQTSVIVFDMYIFVWQLRCLRSTNGCLSVLVYLCEWWCSISGKPEAALLARPHIPANSLNQDLSSLNKARGVLYIYSIGF